MLSDDPHRTPFRKLLALRCAPTKGPCDPREEKQNFYGSGNAIALDGGNYPPEGDPLFALVTMNRLVLEESARTYYEYNQKLIAEFLESMKRAEVLAGSMLAQKVKESAEKMREGLQGDIHIAGLKAREYVHLVNEAHRHPAIIRWVSVGLVAAAAIFATGVWLGPCIHW